MLLDSDPGDFLDLEVVFLLLVEEFSAFFSVNGCATKSVLNITYCD
jgi:hypothetical protein